MKPKEYILKYNLNKPNVSFNHGKFVSDLTLDFTSNVEFIQSQNQLNYTRFKHCITEIRQKFDSISNKMSGTLPEGLWNYFYATVVVKLRDSLFGEYLKQKREKYKQKQEEKRYWERSFEGFFGDFFREHFRALEFPENNSCFSILGLDETSTSEEVKKKFKELSLIHHPDKGGNKEKFLEIINAKNECLMKTS